MPTASTRRGPAQRRPDAAQVRRLVLVLANLDRTLQAAFKRGTGMPHDLTRAQYDVLALLVEAGAQPEATIARHLGVTGPTVVRVVDALEQKGLATRHRGQPDRRVVHVALTATGAGVHRDAAARYEHYLATLLERLPPATQDTLLQALAALLGRTGDTASPTGTGTAS